MGKMKEEICGVPIEGFVGLKSRMYTFITENNHESKNVNGINKTSLMMDYNMTITKMFCSVGHI